MTSLGGEKNQMLDDTFCFHAGTEAETGTGQIMDGCGLEQQGLFMVVMPGSGLHGDTRRSVAAAR